MPTIQGKIIYALEPRTGTNARGSWMVQEFVLESYDQPYPRHCVFSVFGEDRLKQFNIKSGDDVAVDIDIDAREYNGRYYNSVRAWRVAHITPPAPQAPAYNAQPGGYAPQSGAPVPPVAPASGTPSSAPAAPMAPSPMANDDPLAGESSDDLPF